MNQDITTFNNAHSDEDAKICNLLMKQINQVLPEAKSKIWHAHPVWFIEGNPIVGYDKLKDSVRLMFWSGQSFHMEGLAADGSFKAASVRYTDREQIDFELLKQWLEESKNIQWDYKNIVKRKGQLKRLV